MRIAVVGAGYVGLVSGACLAKMGNDVICVDVDEAKINALNSGIIPIYEPGLAEIVAECRANGALKFSVDIQRSLGARQRAIYRGRYAYGRGRAGRSALCTGSRKNHRAKFNLAANRRVKIDRPRGYCEKG